MNVEADIGAGLSRRDCVDLLQLIHFCTVAKGSASDAKAVLARLGQMMPVEATIVATGRHGCQRIAAIDQLHSYGLNAWLSPYRDSEMEQVDPIIQRALVDDAPFRWSEARLTHATQHPGYQALKRDLGRGNGVAAALRSHRHAGRMSLMSLAIGERRISRRHLGIVGQVLPHVHEMLVHADGAQVQLTARELEVLRWVVAGKSNWEIGRILTLSERTAKFHLSNACLKLGAVNRAQGAAKALRLGLVSL